MKYIMKDTDEEMHRVQNMRRQSFIPLWVFNPQGTSRLPNLVLSGFMEASFNRHN
jgi:hypothetical protein